MSTQPFGHFNRLDRLHDELVNLEARRDQLDDAGLPTAAIDRLLEGRRKSIAELERVRAAVARPSSKRRRRTA